MQSARKGAIYQEPDLDPAAYRGNDGGFQLGAGGCGGGGMRACADLQCLYVDQLPAP